ncbi:MAG: hypothetical protein EHM63_02130, partial [Actinobacteria bacterium]
MPDNEVDLKRAFDRAGGSAPSAPAALAGLRTRIRKAHQRRAVARGSAGVLGLVAVGGVIMNIGGDDSGTDVAVTGRNPSDSSLFTSTTLAATSAPGASTTPTATFASSSSAPPSSASSSAATSTESTPAPTTGAVTTSDGSMPATTVFVPTTRLSVGQVAVFTAEGGTIVVDYTSSAMTLTSVT